MLTGSMALPFVAGPSATLALGGEPCGRGRANNLRAPSAPLHACFGAKAPHRHSCVVMAQRELAGQSPEGRVGREVLLDLLDRRPTSKARESTDELHVAEVARGQGVGLAAPVEAEALHRPRADLADPA